MLLVREIEYPLTGSDVAVILAVSDWAVLLVESVTLKYTQYMPLVGGMKIQLFDVAPETGFPLRYDW